MANTNYQKGAQFEWKVKSHFEALGFFVIRSSGSHSILDLMGFKGFADGTLQVIAVQCKTDGVLSKADRLELIAMRNEHHGLIRVLHAYKGDGGHTQFEEIK